MHFDFDRLLDTDDYLEDASLEEVIEEAAWDWLSTVPWVATPELLFAMKAVLRQRALGKAEN